MATSAATPAVTDAISSNKRRGDRLSRQARRRAKRMAVRRPRCRRGARRRGGARCGPRGRPGSGRASRARAWCPTSRLSSDISSITRAPVAASRLPVGSSANSTRGPVAERARQRDALLLAARELGRVVMAAVGEAHPAQQLVRALLGLQAAQLQRHLDVLARGEGRDELEGLEDEADLLPAQARPLVLARASPAPRRRARRGRWWAGPAPPAGRAACSCRCRTGPRMATKDPSGTSSVILFRTGSSCPPDRKVLVRDSQRSMGQLH